MSNDSIAMDIGRLATALDTRIRRWLPVLESLLEAEDVAKKTFLETPIVRRPYITNIFDKNLAFQAAFINTCITPKVSASQLPGWLFSGFYRGEDYFAAIFKYLEGSDQQRFRPTDQNTQLQSFGDVLDRVKRLWMSLARDLLRLQAAARSEPMEWPGEHAADALAAMLLSPVLYAPRTQSDDAQLARRMEWYMWLYYMPHVIEEILQDYYRDQASQETLVDLDPMFARLVWITSKGTDNLVIPVAMRNLKQFRVELENRRIDSNIFYPDHLSPLEIGIDGQFPSGLKNYLASNEEGRRAIVREAAKSITWSEAGL